MYERRLWSVRHPRLLAWAYRAVEFMLRLMHPLVRRVGYRRMDKPVLTIERPIKRFFFDSQSCGQCIVAYTGGSCPMNCPKKMRNGPCGGVRPDGHCEVSPQMPCVWLLAWRGNKGRSSTSLPIQVLQPPVDHQLFNTSAWLRELRRADRQQDRIHQAPASNG